MKDESTALYRQAWIDVGEAQIKINYLIRVFN